MSLSVLRRTVSVFSAASVAIASLLGAASCIVEERRFDEDEARRVRQGSEQGSDDSDAESDEPADDEPSPECTEYCERVMENCTDEFAVYASEETCLAVCALLPLSSDGSNTVECRSEQARLAGSTGERNVHCPPAGPGGSTSRGGGGCGTNCESYCFLQPLACGDTDQLVIEANECLRRCRALPDERSFNAVTHHDGDNVQCRLVHISSAALGPTAAAQHCWHSAITPAPGSPCGLLPDDVPSCEHYCDVVMTACTEEHQVYEELEHCLGACSVMVPGDRDDTIEDSVGCRLYHSYASFEAPGTHCPHASAAGDGHCGKDNCETYCALTQGLCAEAFDETWSSLDACLEECSELEGAGADFGYDLEAARSGNTVACRIYHAVASTEDAELCDAALGASPCD